MRYLITLAFALLVATCSSVQGSVLIDDFDTANGSINFNPFTGNKTATIDMGPGAGINGSWRELTYTVTGKEFDFDTAVAGVGSGRFYLTNSGRHTSYVKMYWDGTGSGIANPDLTVGGNNSIHFAILFADLGLNLKLTITDGDSSSFVNRNFPTQITTPKSVVVPFTEFLGIDFTNVKTVMMEINAPANGDLQLDFIKAAPIPEPSSCIIALGMFGAGAWFHRRRRAIASC